MRFRQIVSEWEEAFRIALEQLRVHKTRSMLTALGVVIGIVAVTLMGTAIKGIDKGFDSSLDMLGKDMIYLEKWPWGDVGDDWIKYRNRPDIKISDADRINDWVQSNPDSLIRIAVPSAVTFTGVERDDVKVNQAFINGTTHTFALVSTADILAGRFFTFGEEQGRQNVAIIGYDIANALFPGRPDDALNKDVRIRGLKFKVIGVLERQGSFLGLQSFDNQVIMPLPALRKFFSGSWRNTIRIQAVAGADMDMLEDELTGVYRRIRGQLPEDENNFEINRSKALESQLGPIKSGIALAGFFVTGLALFVGAIGIMNITFVSVKERTREIGTRRAIGATRSAILTQFLIEAVSICLLGGIIGLISAFLFKSGFTKLFPDFPFTFSTDLVILAVFLSVLTGIASGLAPAYQASKLDPANALRHE